MILPEGVLEIFEVTHVKEEHTGRQDARGVEIVVIHIYLDERELSGEESEGLEPNGFTEPRLINDFPIRDHKVELHVRRRRWKTAEGHNKVRDVGSIVAEGTSYSKEFAGALKKIFGYVPHSSPFTGGVL